MRRLSGSILAVCWLFALPAAACLWADAGTNGCQPPKADMIVTLSVSESFSGNAGPSLMIQTDTSDCGYPFETGHEYLIFANRLQGNLNVNTCTDTAGEYGSGNHPAVARPPPMHFEVFRRGGIW